MELFQVDEFHSYQEYEKLKDYLKWLVNQNILTEIENGKLPVIVPIFENEEKWYKDNENNVWVLIPPDFPFKGFFKQFSDIK